MADTLLKNKSTKKKTTTQYDMYKPDGSTSLANFKASEFARSEFAGDTAKIKQLSLPTNCSTISRICCSISAGWPATAIFVIPGRSIKVRFNTKNWKGNRRKVVGIHVNIKVSSQTIFLFSTSSIFACLLAG